MALFSPLDRRGGKFFKNGLSSCLGFFSPSQLLLFCLLWEKTEVKIREGLRPLSFQRNLRCLKLSSIFRHFLKCHDRGIVEGVGGLW